MSQLPPSLTAQERTELALEYKRLLQRLLRCVVLDRPADPIDYLLDKLRLELRRNTRVTAEAMVVDGKMEDNFKVNQYEVSSMIGRGSFGHVYLCRDDHNGAKYALKVLNKRFLKRHRVGRFGSWLDKARQEAAVWKKLDHPNVAFLHEIIDGPSSDSIYMVSEHLEGGQLCVDSSHPQVYSEGDAKFLFSQIASGLAYMHRNRVAHRDIKPENILLSDPGVGSRPVPKLVDFGVSQLFDRGSGDLVSNTVGSYSFMAPEMWADQEFHAMPTDVWALGITLYMMLKGKVPYEVPEAEAGGHVVAQIQTLGNVISSCSFENCAFEETDNLSPSLANLLRSLLHSDPGRRITIDEVLQHEWLDGASGGPRQNPIQPTEEEIRDVITKLSVYRVVAAERIAHKLAHHAHAIAEAH